MKRWTMLLLIAAPLSIGCGTTGPVTQDEPDRLAVTSELRTACSGVGFPPNLGLSDQDIETLLVGVDTDRQAGVTKTQEVLSILPVCEGYPVETQFSCDTCYTAIINQVYAD